ncbi:hypothetical protein NFHSH190041_15460 [Shewanella sp. NFH-SH190041]|uniref:ATP-binding cassette domain-containing protein n=1 Tax=Shewanella sp. NFH-SH190041 TaxID=2950245 RepID=UPI0021C28D51|nr:ATP-binding cassette domain-containing protein [Shewanella sp. NFH-SH190041]BDM64094.1 hypothetical protein NFHSH190041_15460 [Shewanella sp. NFH-SH190041]
MSYRHRLVQLLLAAFPRQGFVSEPFSQVYSANPTPNSEPEPTPAFVSTATLPSCAAHSASALARPVSRESAMAHVGLNVTDLGVQAVSGQWLLQPLSFSLQPGQIMGVIGGSGSGKSILADAMMGVVPRGFRRQGEMSLPHTDMALAAQSAAVLDPLRRVATQIRRRLASDAYGQNSSMMALARLPQQVGHCYPLELSGGMAKQALLTLAEVQQRPYLIADEPCCGLDSAATTHLYQHLRQLADEGRGIIVISHNLRALCQVADHLLVLRDGELVEQTTPMALASGQVSDYSRALWQSLPENWLLDTAKDVLCCR